MQVDLNLPTVQDVDRELQRNLRAFSKLCAVGTVRFPSVGVTALAILDTADCLGGMERLLYLQEVVDRLNGWINDELMAEAPCFVEYPQREERLIAQGGG